MSDRTPTPKLRRSVLYVPGAHAKALAKAASLDADVLVLDLEDSVAPEQKTLARAQVMHLLPTLHSARREVVVRINGPDTPWGAQDVQALASVAADAWLVPKVSTPQTLQAVAQLAAQAACAQPPTLWAMIETPRGVLELPAIAALATDPTLRLQALVVGTNDLVKETRMRLKPGRAALLGWLADTVAAARAYGLDVIDGVWNDFSDTAGLRAECEQGRDLGMDGKSLIHPGQIAIANEIFAPSAEEIAAARHIADAFAQPENVGRGVISLDGRMVELLHAEMAQRTLALAAAIAQRHALAR